MSNKVSKAPLPVIFREQMPDMLIGRETWERLYERAFLIPESEEDCEFGRNTTTWD